MILDCNEIIPNRIWIGRFVRPEEMKLLKQLEITTVISLQSDEDLENYGLSNNKKIIEGYSRADIELRRIPVPDFSQDELAIHLDRCVEELEAALAPRWARVYLHCTAGINRSPTVVAAFLIKSQGMKAGDAFAYVTTRRRCSPYLNVLEHYEASLTAGSKQANST